MELWMLGGDRRSFWTARALQAEGHAVHTFRVPGRTDEPLPETVRHMILPMPCLREGKIPATEPFAPGAALSRLSSGSFVCGGLLERLGLPADVRAAELYGAEPMTTQNAVATAEGALAEAIVHTDGTLHASRCLVLGFGRVGLALAQRLRGLSARVTVAARRTAARAQAEALGFASDVLGSYGRGLAYDYVFNTVPAPVLSARQLACLPSDCLLLELASAPGGFSREEAQRLGLRTVYAPGLPARCCPRTAGTAYAQAILNVLEEEA